MNYIGLFEGISGFGLAFKRAGATILAVCEINSDCQKVLRRHHPDAELISDVKTINANTFNGESIAVLAGGFPCQDLSVAGQRKGLAGERSGLWFEFIRIIGDHKPRWVVIENVPGLLSSNSGRDFAVILRGLVECGYGVCWRVLDSQYDGVAQRRARVFVVASFGSADAAEILFERDGSAWDSPPRREAEARIAPTLESGANRTGGTRPPGSTVDTAESLTPQLAGTLRSNGDAHSGFEFADGLVAATLNSGGNSGGFRTEPGEHLVAFNWQAGGNQTTLGADAEKTSCLHVGQVPAIAFAQNTRDEVRYINGDGLVADTLRTKRPGEGGIHGDDTHLIPVLSPSLNTQSGSHHAPDTKAYVASQFGVRRLTPTECERLQGFPDGHTAFGDDGKPISDSARYRMLGNAVCVPTAEWIARRIAAQEAA